MSTTESEDAEWAELLKRKIKAAVEEEREACASLFESVRPSSDTERLNNVPGADAMGAVLEFRDLIRARSK